MKLSVFELRMILLSLSFSKSAFLQYHENDVEKLKTKLLIEKDKQVQKTWKKEV